MILACGLIIRDGTISFSGLPETGYIAKQLQELDELVIRTKSTPKALARREQSVSLLLHLKNSLLQISTFLKTIFDEESRHEVGMDVLTRLLNRRFLPTIFKREIAHANRNGTSLSIDCAMFSGHPDYERLIQAADGVLCRAKARGRNQVEM